MSNFNSREFTTLSDSMWNQPSKKWWRQVLRFLEQMRDLFAERLDTLLRNPRRLLPSPKRREILRVEQLEDRVVPTITAGADSFDVLHDRTLSVSASGVLSSDTGSSGPLSAVLTTGVAHGSITLNSNGSLSYIFLRSLTLPAHQW